VMILACTFAYHFLVNTTKECEVFYNIHWILFTLGLIIFMASCYYIAMQCRMGVFKPKRKKNHSATLVAGEPNVEPRPVLTKHFICKKRLMVALTLLHIVWTIGYHVQHLIAISHISRSTGVLENGQV